ncbi:MAG: hypothetical protein FOGNACKC_02310 [Anaerolineae bacterium]|nr:hypothetical protein [Anaerolineae bacterium]
MKNLRIGQKILIVVGAIFVLFAIGLTAIIGTTSFNNLTEVKQAELNRMSQIMASRISDMEKNSALVAMSFEQDEPLVNEIQLLTNLGPYYADPGSYFAEDFTGSGELIEDADKIFVFQAQLKLVQLLQSAQRLNDLSSISFYLVSPFEVVANAKPALSFRLDKDNITLTQFMSKGNGVKPIYYQVPTSEFTAPPADYFDISSAYSAPPEQFYAENNFKPVIGGPVAGQDFPFDWTVFDTPQSTIVVNQRIPVIQTWYPVKIAVADPVTWEPATVPVGLAMVERRLDAATISFLRNQLGLEVGLAQKGQLLITSLDLPGAATAPTSLLANQTVTLNQNEYYYDQQPVGFAGDSGTQLEAVVLSPVSELQQLTQNLRNQISWVALGVIILGALLLYIILRYLVNRPLGAVMAGVETIAAGDLSQSVPVQSQDELGQLGAAFNNMAEQLRDLVGSLEQRVLARTQRLETVASMGERLSAILSVDQLLVELVNKVKESFNYYHVHVYMLDSAGEYLVMREGYGMAGAQMKASGHRIELRAQTSLVARAARTGEVVKIDNVRGEPDWLPNPLLPNTYSEMAVPIIVENQVVGVLDVQSDRIAGLDESDASLLRSLANQVAVTINNARLFQQMQQAHAEAEELNRRLTREAWQNIGAQTQTTGYVFTKAGAAPAPTEWLPAMERAVQSRQLTQATGSTNGGDSHQKTATVAVPLTLRGEVIGVIGIERPVDRQWSPDEITTVQSISEQVTLALDAARLARETERAAWRDHIVSESTAKVWSSSEIDDVMKIAVAQLAETLRASEVVIRLGTEENLLAE